MMRRAVMVAVALALAACDRFVDLTPAPDASHHRLDSGPVDAAVDGLDDGNVLPDAVPSD